jgi:uncharacterized protein (TIGR00730 family)
MEAANRGASDVGAPSIGFNIELPREQQPNPYSTPELTFQFHSFAMRKIHLAIRAAGVVAFPGGFGTLAELFEVLTLVQTRKGRSVPLVCVDRSYWTQVINFDMLLNAGVISPEDFRLLRFAEDAESAWEELAAAAVIRAATAYPDATSDHRIRAAGPEVRRAASRALRKRARCHLSGYVYAGAPRQFYICSS